MDREIDLARYFPGIMREIREFQAVAEAENPEFQQLFQVMEDVLHSAFVEEANDAGVKRWETMLQIIPKDTDTLDVRRFRLLAAINERIPYTMTTLRQQLSLLCGESGYSLELKNNEYTLVVRVQLTAKKKLHEVENLLERIRPANMVLDISLLYNRHRILEEFTHGYLTRYTQEQVRSEVMNGE